MPKLSKTMSKDLVTIAWDRSMDTAQHLMEKHKIRHLAVTDEFGVIFGILSSHDVARAHLPTRPGFPDGAAVCNYCSLAAITLDVSTPLADVADLMSQEKISSVLITEGEHNVKGIITTDDLVRAYSRMLRAADRKNSGPIWTVVGELMRELGAMGI